MDDLPSGRPQWQELETAGHTASTVKAESNGCACSSLSPVNTVQVRGRGTVPSTIKTGVPHQGKYQNSVSQALPEAHLTGDSRSCELAVNATHYEFLRAAVFKCQLPHGMTLNSVGQAVTQARDRCLPECPSPSGQCTPHLWSATSFCLPHGAYCFPTGLHICFLTCSWDQRSQ